MVKQFNNTFFFFLDLTSLKRVKQFVQTDKNTNKSFRKTIPNFAWEACCFACSISRNMEINIKRLGYLNGTYSIYIYLKTTDEWTATGIYE